LNQKIPASGSPLVSCAQQDLVLVKATIALGLLALGAADTGAQADAQAAEI